MHRLRAHQQAGLDHIAIEEHDVPATAPSVKVYAASLSTRHGDRMSTRDLEQIALEEARRNVNTSQRDLAKWLGISQPTVSRWLSPLTERRKLLRQVKAMLLQRAGWSTRKIGGHLDISEAQVRNDIQANITAHLTEELLRQAAQDLPVDCEQILEEIREERIFADWSPEERHLLKRLRNGETIVVTLRGDHNGLIAWADSAGLYVRVDRQTVWGNPFEMGKDGDRDTVIRNYEVHYLPHKPSLAAKLDTLRGKALGCWCAPEPCHADVLKARADQ
jgi:DNA-binding MarR family transcriptional regulator